MYGRSPLHAVLGWLNDLRLGLIDAGESGLSTVAVGSLRVQRNFLAREKEI